jgi:putative ABC transport system substrate-binding protein
MVLASTLAVAAWPRRVDAQGASRVFRIGWLTAQSAPSLVPYVQAFRGALADLGYVEGRNAHIEFRYGDDVVERVPELAAELVRLPVDLIVAQGLAVFQISKLGLPVPVVYVYSGDPIQAGLAETLARPRGNMTGLTFMAVELNGKRLELLREIMPRLRRVAILANPEHPGERDERLEAEAVGGRLGLEILYFPARSRDELTGALTAIAAASSQAISLFADGFAVQYRQPIIDYAISQRIPVTSGWPVFAQSGALCTYGPRLVDSYRRLAYYADRILKGAKPPELPIEQPTTFELVINLKTANALGLVVPQAVLLRADSVIR